MLICKVIARVDNIIIIVLLQGSRLEFFTSIHYGYQHFKLGIQIQKPVSKYKNISW